MDKSYRFRLKRYWRELDCHKYSTHSLRHGAGTHMLKNGAPLHAISFFLGHKDIGSTAIYTKINPSEVRDAIDDIEKKGQEEAEEEGRD